MGRDGFRIARARGYATIAAASRAGRLSALLALASMQREKRRTLTRRLRFNHRNYKFELPMRMQGHRSIANHTEEFWMGLCRELVRRHFNGVVFYIGMDPFQAFLDFDRFAEFSSVPSRSRRAFRDRFNMILGVCRRFGLETIVQQYITHIPGKAGAACGLPFSAPQDRSSVFSDFKHPRVYAFLRYAYARLFDLCPGIDRLLLNFESAPVSSEFLHEVLVPALSRLDRPPALFFRLWYMTNPRVLCDVIERYPGHCMVGHKIMDTMDAYNYPAADPRIVEWREWFQRRGLDVEWNYLMGPCHNCGSNISRRAWSDPEFVHVLLRRALQLGADGINFHTVRELLANEYPSAPVIDDEERAWASLNRPHLDGMVDFVRGRAFSEPRTVARAAERFGIDARRAGPVHRMLRDSSRAQLLPLLQFPLTTHEGYAVDARRQLSQHPLFHPPANVLLNHQEREDPHMYWCFVNRTRRAGSYPENMQTLIDYVDPEQPTLRQHPAALADRMERLGEKSWRTARCDAWSPRLPRR